MSVCSREKKPAHTLEILSLLYSINTEMKACCATYESNSKIYILYKQYIYQFVYPEVCGGS